MKIDEHYILASRNGVLAPDANHLCGVDILSASGWAVQNGHGLGSLMMRLKTEADAIGWREISSSDANAVRHVLARFKSLPSAKKVVYGMALSINCMDAELVAANAIQSWLTDGRHDVHLLGGDLIGHGRILATIERSVKRYCAAMVESLVDDDGQWLDRAKRIVSNGES